MTRGRARELYLRAGPLPIVALLGALLGLVFFTVRVAVAPGYPLVSTIADLQAVHAGVEVAGTRVRGFRRVASGESISTDVDGRARLRLDGGTAAVVDRATRLTVDRSAIVLAEGRLFVRGATGAPTELRAGQLVAFVSGSAAAIEARQGGPKIYSVDGEIVVRGPGGEKKLGAGETATVSGGKLETAPERAFDDWTGGLAAPWGADGPAHRAIGELWARPVEMLLGDPGSPLTIRSHAIDARIEREVARTRTETTYFNGGSDVVNGDFRMAVPRGAIVSAFSVRRGDQVEQAHIALASRDKVSLEPDQAVLEWAGEGWLRGSVPKIRPGENVGMIVEWVEWLTPQPRQRNVVVEYRYPLVGEGAPPLIGEFSAHVDAGPSSPLSIAVGQDATVGGRAVELRRSDFRPTADLVVDVEMPRGSGQARLYEALGEPDDEAGGTVVLRTELPTPDPSDGVTLALLLDVSGSMDSMLLDAGRSFVEAVLGALGARDRVVVLAADQTVRAIGPSAIGSVDAARRQAVTHDLGGLEPGGATDLGRALEVAADALPANAPAAMLIYVGDGWPTIGDVDVEAIQSRLARRPGGAPRIGAVAVGPLANRAALAALTRGSGALLEIGDSSDAAGAAIELVADALKPAVASVEVDFGPLVDRVYPRTARTVVAGETFTAVGRVRDGLPGAVMLRWRDSKGLHEEQRRVELVRSVADDDVRRRWAAARVEEIVLAGKGREAATDVALRTGLLTPWTALRTASDAEYTPTPLETRVLDLSSGGTGVIGPVLATPTGEYGSLSAGDEAETSDGSEAELKNAVAAEAERVIGEAGQAVRACRDSRAALRPELAGALQATLEIDGDGKAKNVRVRGATPGSEDPALDRCVEVVLSGLRYPESGLSIKIDELIQLPPSAATLRARQCSATSLLPMPLRRGVWRERLQQRKAVDVYVEAKQKCELMSWTDRRALLELVLLRYEDGSERLEAARELDRAGETEAAALLRREAVRRARTPAELAEVRRGIVGDERIPIGVFEKRYKAASDDAARLAVVRRLLTVAPHDGRLRQKLVLLLEALGKRRELVDEIRRLRLDPFADARLLADCAAALRRAGDEQEARRVFGELVERAPRDPWVRAFLGDRLRAEGWFDEAVSAYAALDTLAPDDPAAVLRLALAHAGAKRLDIAERLLGRVAQTGGRAGDGRLASLASRLAEVLIAEARGRPGLPRDDGDRLLRVALEIPRDGESPVLLVRAPPAALPLDITLRRGPATASEERKPEAAAESLGLYAVRLDREKAKLVLRRPAALPPARATHVRLDALLPQGKSLPPRLVTKEVELPYDGKAVELDWTGDGFG